MIHLYLIWFKVKDETQNAFRGVGRVGAWHSSLRWAIPVLAVRRALRTGDVGEKGAEASSEDEKKKKRLNDFKFGRAFSLNKKI